MAVDGSEDDKLQVKDILEVEVGDWKQSNDHEKIEPDNPVEVDEATEKVDCQETNKVID